MRRKLIYASLTGLVIFLAISALPVQGGIRPSFSLDGCSWDATHIVLVQTTARDGVFSVVQSWKGDLKPGDSLEVPQLKPDGKAVPISKYPKPEGFGFSDTQVIAQQIPRQPVGSQMILFLKKKQEGGSAPASAGNATDTQWQPTGNWSGMKLSALWIDGGKGFCFRQWANPGPSALYECTDFSVMSSEVGVLIARMERVLKVQKDLAFAIARQMPAELKADRVGFIALGDVWRAQREALDILGHSGTVALPEILQVMDKPPVPSDGTLTIQALVEAAGKDSGRLLHARLQQDLIYWKAIAPTLTPDWSRQLIEPGASLYVKFDETRLLIRELDREHYAPAAQTASDLRDFWVSQPLLYDPKWGERDLSRGGTVQEGTEAQLFAFAKACDDFVKHVAAVNPQQ
jgi:hypothetical protein